jgi:hypothetical protein
MIRCLYSLARSLACLDHRNARRLRTPSSSPIPLTFGGQPWSRVCGQNPPQKHCAFEKASSLQTEGHAKLPRNLHVDDAGKTRSMSVKRLAYTRFRSYFEIFFSCRKSCRTAPGARERRLLKGLEDERHGGISRKIRFPAQQNSSRRVYFMNEGPSYFGVGSQRLPWRHHATCLQALFR